jgi:purine-nucleoside phosphorylase
VVLTNAAGSLNPARPVGGVVVVADQINATGQSPMTGPNPPPGYPGRFADMTEMYSRRLRALVRAVDPSLPEGVYLGLNGPQFETPAEIRAAATAGADLCGMSMAIEAIAARHLGLELLGLSLVTNLAAGLGEASLSVEEVHAVAAGQADALGQLLRAVLDRIVAEP